MIEQSRNEKKLLAIERAKFKLRQRLEAIDWEYDTLKPLINEFKGKAQLPELPSETLVTIDDASDSRQA